MYRDGKEFMVRLVSKKQELIRVTGFEGADEAAIAHDRLSLGLGLPRSNLNFPERNLTPVTLTELREERQKATRLKRLRRSLVAAGVGRTR